MNTAITTIPALSSIQLSEAAVAFDQCRDEIEAVHDDALVAIRTDIPSAVVAVVGAWPSIEPLLAQFQVLGDFDLSMATRLVLRALAAWQAHILYLLANAGDDPQQTATDTTEARDQARACGTMLVQFRRLDEKKLAKIRQGQSQKEIALELGALVQLFRSHLDEFQGIVPLTEELLHHWATLSTTLLALVGVRESGAAPATSEAALVRQKAFTLFVQSYDQVRRAVTYLRWGKGDADIIAPSIYARDSSPSAKKSEPATSAPTTTTPATPEPVKSKDDVTMPNVTTVQMAQAASTPAVPPAKGGGPFIE